MNDKLFRTGLCALAFCFIFASEAHAQYVDPGSSLMLWQIVVAAVIGIAFTIRTKIFALILRRSPKGDTPSAVSLPSDASEAAES